MSNELVEYATKKQVKKSLGDPSDSTLRRWVQLGILPPMRQIGPNRVGFVLQELNQKLKNFPIANRKDVCPGAKRGRKPSAKRGTL